MDINNILKDSSKIGLFIENKDKNILVKKENLKKIQKTIYNVPVVNLSEEKTNIQNEIKETFKNIEIKSFINEIKYLDEFCNEKKQTNIHCELNEKVNIDSNEYKWVNLEDLNLNVEVPEYITTAVAIHKYNEGRKE